MKYNASSEDLYATLRQAGIPVAYGRFREKVAPPLMIYTGDGQADVIADGEVYAKSNNYTVELYFTEKDEALEGKIEDLLNAAGWTWQKSSDVYLDDEDAFEIYYSIE